MIDTDKYTEHTPAPWIMRRGKSWQIYMWSAESGSKIRGVTTDFPDLKQMAVCDPEDYVVAQANQVLIQDAPLLLAEVKRLREAFITAVRHVGEHDVILSRDDLFSKLDEDLFSLWLFRSE